LGIILIGLGLVGWMVMKLSWANIGLYLLAVLGAAAQTLKVEGPNDKTNHKPLHLLYNALWVPALKRQLAELKS